MISTQEATAFIYAVAFGVTSASFIVAMSAAWFVWARLDGQRRETAKDCERRIQELEEQHRADASEIKAWKDMFIAWYPSMGQQQHLVAGRDLNVGEDVIGRDKQANE